MILFELYFIYTLQLFFRQNFDLANHSLTALIKSKLFVKAMMNPNTDPGFSNVQSTPTVAQPATPANSQRIQLNKGYITSLNGILRLIIIVRKLL